LGGNVDLYDKYKNLKTAEKEFVWAHPVAAANFNANASRALEEAKKRFAGSSLHNGSGDAFRHCFWSAMNARDEGKDLAKQFGDAHEDFMGNPPAEKTMDLHNNGVGYGIGSKAPGAPDRYLAVQCVQAWASGRLAQTKSANGGDLIYSNSTETFLYGEK
jgi:hypothetical protein